MSLMNLATVFGPSLLRPPVAGLGPGSVPVDISQEVVVQVSPVFHRNRVIGSRPVWIVSTLRPCSRCRWCSGSCSAATSLKLGRPCSPTRTKTMRPPTYETAPLPPQPPSLIRR